MGIRAKYLGWIAAPLGIAMAVPAWSEVTGKLTVPIRASGDDNAPVVAHQVLYGSSHALVIGIDEYTNGWPRLKNAVRDAEEVARALGARGFRVTLKKNLKASELREAMREFFILHGQDPASRLFLWYAGHGHTTGGEGFLVPADAPPPTDAGNFQFKSLHMRDFSGLVRLAKSKHVLSIFDSCFAGTVFDSRATGAPPAITRATARPVRQFITSGDADQEVSDDGTFRTLFLRAISGDENADPNRDGYLTGGELGIFLSDRVTNLTESTQTPRFGKLRDRNYDQGDFVFAIPAVLERAAASEAWAEVKNSDDRLAIEGFLAAHPNSDFAEPARRRLAELSVASQPEPAPEDIAAATTRRWSEQQALLLEGARRQAEITFWDSIKDSKSPEDFADYLQQFPDGTFAGLAKRRVKQLEAQQTAALTAPEPAEPALTVSPLDEFRVSVKTANIRAEPTTKSQRVGQLAPGTRIAVTGLTTTEGANWYRVVLDDGSDGFVFGTLLQDEAEWTAAARRAEAAAAERKRRDEQAAAERRRQESERAAREAREAAERQRAEADAAAKEKKSQATPAQATEQELMQEEVAYWHAIKDGGAAADFESYLARYPNGLFADAARTRLEQQVAVVVPSQPVKQAPKDSLEPIKQYLTGNSEEIRQKLSDYNYKNRIYAYYWGTGDRSAYNVARIDDLQALSYDGRYYVVKVKFLVAPGDWRNADKHILHLYMVESDDGFEISRHEKP